MIRWQTGTEIGSQARLVQLLEEVQSQAQAEGLRYESAVLEVRRRAAERNRRELAAMEADDG